MQFCIYVESKEQNSQRIRNKHIDTKNILMSEKDKIIKRYKLVENSREYSQ